MQLDIPMRAFRRAFAAIVLASATLAAQQSNAAHQSAPVPAAGAVLRTAPVSVDGLLDDAHASEVSQIASKVRPLSVAQLAQRV